MKIVLIGFMGTGKSSVAPLLAQKLGLEAIEMDDLILDSAQENSIPAIFEQGGETAFRTYEQRVAQQLVDRDNIVISSGGGVVTKMQTWKPLATNATVICLTAPFETIVQRVGDVASRPLFKDLTAARLLYDERQQLYEKYAAIQIDTTNASITEVTDLIITSLEGAFA